MVKTHALLEVKNTSKEVEREKLLEGGEIRLWEESRERKNVPLGGEKSGL